MPAAVLYMPLIIIVIAAFLVFLDKPFVSKLFKSFNIDETFKAVVKDLELLTPQNRREKVHLTNYLDALSTYYTIFRKFVLSLSCLVQQMAFTAPISTGPVDLLWQHSFHYLS